MIGIEFSYKTNYEKIVFELLKGIDFDKYSYSIMEDELFAESTGNKDLPNVIIGSDFLNYFNKEDYYVMFLNLQVYLKGENIMKIRNYNDFLNSNCKLILLISDNSYIEFYFKTDDIKSVILKNLKSMNIKYDIKTKDNDGRTTMYLNKIG